MDTLIFYVLFALPFALGFLAFIFAMGDLVYETWPRRRGPKPDRLRIPHSDLRLMH